MKTCKEGTSSGQLKGLPVTPDLPGFVARHHCPFVLRLCPAFVVAFYQRICPRLHCGFVPFVSRICHHHLTGYIAREDFHLYYHLCQISPSVFSLQKNVNLTFGFNLNFAFEFRPLYKLINNRLKCPSPLQPISEIDIRFQGKHWASQDKCVLTFSRQEFCVKGDNNYG